MNPNLNAFWMPFTANRQFKAKPRLMASAQGMYYKDIEGREVLDGTAGLWCVNAGHGRSTIAEAVKKQIETLDFAPTFQMGHPGPFELADRLTEITPSDLNAIFFANSGSEAVDTALKIAIAYHRAKGDSTRTRLIGRERGYHGTGFGGISVGGIETNRRGFGPLLSGVDHLPHTHNLEHNAYSHDQPEWGAHLADDLERIVTLHDASTIAAVIVEPVAGSTGVLIPPKGYLEKLRSICDKHGILLIFDEVITGFGRMGTPFAADYFNIIPDMMCVAKGITNGCVPMGAVFAKESIREAFMQGPESAIELFHGYTYSGHPLACAAALATLDIYQNENLFDKVTNIAPYWQDALQSLKDINCIIDIRTIGLIAGIELEPIAGSPGARAYKALVNCFEQDLLIRTTGDIIALSPPLIIEKEQIDRIVTRLKSVLSEL